MVKASINPATLVWARERARFTPEQLAKKLPVKTDRYLAWEEGTARPTLRQLYLLSRTLRQPLATFYLENAPEEPEPLREMRRLPGTGSASDSPEVALRVSELVERRRVALELFEELGETPPTLEMSASLSQDPEHVGEELRSLLGITVDTQVAWKDMYAALRGWRSACEARGVLVFHVPRVPLKDMRGFAMALSPLPIVAINSADWVRARIFTMLHEVGHLLLGDSILHDHLGSWFDVSQQTDIEQFCNAVAGACLVPRAELADTVGTSPPSSWRPEDFASLASRYQVSRAVILRRLRLLNLISEHQYREFQPTFDSPPSRSSAPGGGDYYANQGLYFGSLLPTLAFRAHHENRFSTSSLSSLLGIQVRHLSDFEERVVRRDLGHEAA